MKKETFNKITNWIFRFGLSTLIISAIKVVYTAYDSNFSKFTPSESREFFILALIGILLMVIGAIERTR